MSAGFYKIDMDNEYLVYASNRVDGPGFSINKDDEDKSQAVHGWRWFDNDTAAYLYFGMTPGSQLLTISPLQVKLALNAAGLLDDVESFVAGSTRDTQIAWDNATEFNRSSPMLNQLAAAMGLSQDDLDDLFTAARSISV